MELREELGKWYVYVFGPDEKIQWCRENLGPSGLTSKYRWTVKWADEYRYRAAVADGPSARVRKRTAPATFIFRDKEAAALFKLRFI